MDDGARDAAEAIEMLRIASADGIRKIVATPHAEYAIPGEIAQKVAQLNELATEHGLDIEVLPGSEVRIGPGLVDLYHGGRLFTLNGTSYILLELLLGGDWPEYLQQTIYELQLAGLMPVLAHAERYPAVQRRPDILLDLIEAGVVIQVNATSLLGVTGSRSRATAETLLRRNMAHLIASDAHSSRRRAPRLQAALRRAACLAGPAYATVLQENAEQVLSGKPLALPEPTAPPPRSLMARVRHFLAGD